MAGFGPLHGAHVPVYSPPLGGRDLSHSAKLFVGCWLFAQPMTPALSRQKKRQMKMMSLSICISPPLSYEAIAFRFGQF
jgi:hypothetical protein